MKFATRNSAITKQFWRENVTHVVISSENSSIFRRAFEFLMAILFGKWVISIECKKISQLIFKFMVPSVSVKKESPHWTKSRSL